MLKRLLDTIFHRMSHLSQSDIKVIVCFLIAAVLWSSMIWVIENRKVLSILWGRKVRAVKSINPNKRSRIYKTTGYFVMNSADTFSVYTPHYTSEGLSMKNVKLLGSATGSKTECLLAFEKGGLKYVIFLANDLYNVLFETFVITAGNVLKGSIGVYLIWQIILSQL